MIGVRGRVSCGPYVSLGEEAFALVVQAIEAAKDSESIHSAISWSLLLADLNAFKIVNTPITEKLAKEKVEAVFHWRSRSLSM